MSMVIFLSEVVGSDIIHRSTSLPKLLLKYTGFLNIILKILLMQKPYYQAELRGGYDIPFDTIEDMTQVGGKVTSIKTVEFSAMK